MDYAALHRLFLRFRRRRMAAFYATLAPTAHTRVLDIGGTPNTWLAESPGTHTFPVTLVNIRPTPTPTPRFTALTADATHLPFPDRAFDIVFSNSVIEHLTTWPRQQGFAAEALRTGRALWVQTPARHFPIESHLLAPFFQYLPRPIQRRTARWLTLRGLLTRPSQAQIDEILSDIRLLTYREMQQLFPNCRIVKEKFLGLTKSYIAIRTQR